MIDPKEILNKIRDRQAGLSSPPPSPPTIKFPSPAAIMEKLREKEDRPREEALREHWTFVYNVRRWTHVRSEGQDAMVVWLRENVNQYGINGPCVGFMLENDAFAFKMRWQ